MLYSPHSFSYSRSPAENAKIKQGRDVGAAKASCSPSTAEAREFKDNSCISSKGSQWDSCDSEDLCTDNPAEGSEECKGARKSGLKLKQDENEADAAYPEPRLPYPCLSTLSSKEQKMYLDILMSKNRNHPSQVQTFTPSWYLNPASPCSIASSNNPLLYFRV